MNSKRIERTKVDQPKSAETAAPLTATPQPRTELPHLIHAAAVYTVEDLRRVFGLKASSVRREVRLGRLRIAKRCGRYYCLGQWVQQWIESGELKRGHGQEEADVGGVGSDGRST